jgi:hypothetical protein
MTYLSIDDYELVGFLESKLVHKKYTAFLKNKFNKKIKKIHFGNINHHFRDRTGLYYYSYLDHNDEELRDIWRSKNLHRLKEGFYSPTYFNFNYLF